MSTEGKEGHAAALLAVKLGRRGDLGQHERGRLGWAAGSKGRVGSGKRAARCRTELNGLAQWREGESEFPFSIFFLFRFFKTKFKHDQSQIQMGFQIYFFNSSKNEEF